MQWCASRRGELGSWSAMRGARRGSKRVGGALRERETPGWLSLFIVTARAAPAGIGVDGGTDAA
jgi:hypothetical protein